MQQPVYETGDFPIDTVGWQVNALGRMLYPGGPSGLRVISREYPPFFAAWRYGRENEVHTVISHIGGVAGGSFEQPVKFTQAEMSIVQERLHSYFMEYGKLLTGEHVTSTEFRDEDVQVEIF